MDSGSYGNSIVNIRHYSEFAVVTVTPFAPDDETPELYLFISNLISVVSSPIRAIISPSVLLFYDKMYLRKIKWEAVRTR